MDTKEILVIDLFAGPGGLGEGFSSCEDKNGDTPFKIGISVEKEIGAHTTLTTRAFFRKTTKNAEARTEYYKYVRGEITRTQLFQKFPTLAEEAQAETLYKPTALGKDNERIHSRISELVEQHSGSAVVIGGPPCQAYSLAGRSRNAGNKEYNAKDDHRHFLYQEYLEVLAIAQPEIFVMENVRGILSSKVEGRLIFPQILEDLKEPGKATKKNKCSQTYKVYSLVAEAEDPQSPNYPNTSDFLIRSEKYGIPQARHRVILLGVRNDIIHYPATLQFSDTPVTTQQAISDLPELRSGLSKGTDNNENWEKIVKKNASRLKKIFNKRYPLEKNKLLKLQPKRGLKRSSTEFHKIQRKNLSPTLNSWLTDTQLNYVLNHETRGHIENDLLRYAFCAAYAHIHHGISPKSRNFPEQLAPAHANWTTGKHADRFRVQVANKPATTVTSHISKDGHYFIHYDPQQCRSLTVREAARLQTFPDNYFFEGTRTQQYVQVGNAVPPLLANKIAKIVIEIIS